MSAVNAAGSEPAPKRMKMNTASIQPEEPTVVDDSRMEIRDNASDDEEDEEEPMSIIAQFQRESGENVGPQLDLPITSNVKQMEELVNELLQNGKEKVPYSLFVGDTEVSTTLQATINDLKLSTESALTITFQPLAVFRVRPVTRCSDTLQGHSEAVLHVSFSPDGRKLASGGGDATVRFWDTSTCMPKHTGRGHKHHVLCTAWSPDGEKFASTDKAGEIRMWDPKTGECKQVMKGHRQWINSISWEPLHRNASCERFATASKDASIKIWNARTGRQIISLTGHTDSVECVKWGGQGLLYTASRDRTIKVWNVEGDSIGKLVRTLSGHGHRINTLALNVDYVCRTGPFSHKNNLVFNSREDMQEAARKRYEGVKQSQPERLVSGSDDFTLFMWEPETSKKPVERLTGHVQPVNHLCFSPDGRYFASASFDKKVKVWNGSNGKFVSTLTGHVGSVYQVGWSSDSRLIVSASKDSTVKVWELSNPKTAKATLSGHHDEVYALDWSPNGAQVASGSKDRTIKIWKH